MALILAALLIVGHARSEPAGPATETLQKKLEKREQARRAAVLEQQRRSEIFDRQCRKPVKSAEELEVCKAVYRQM